MQSRKDEIKAKRARLEELKRQREQRERDFAGSRQSLNASTSRPVSPATGEEQRRDLDSLISSLIPEAPPRDQATSPAGPARFPGRVNYGGDEAVQSVEAATPAPAPQPRLGAYTAPQPLGFAPLRTVYEIRTEKSKLQVESSSKGVQTVSWSTSSSAASSDAEPDAEARQPGERPPMRKLSRRQRERDEQLKQQIRKEVEDEIQALKEQIDAAEASLAASTQEKPIQQAPEISAEEVTSVKNSYDFLDFLDRSSKVVEKALYDDYDILADYRLDKLQDDEDDVGDKSKKGKRIKEVVQFYDEKWSKRRMITDLQFSEKHPELLLSSHTKNSSDPYSPSGVLNLWSLQLPTRPETTFTCTSDILTAKFHPYHHTLLVGATYSGTIHLWDTRSRSQTPVSSTSPLHGGHSHPIYSLEIVGTQNAHNIVSTSTDGLTCTWATDQLSAPPLQTVQLTAPQSMMNPCTLTSTGRPISRSPYANDLAVTSTAFPQSGTGSGYFLAATEQGPIHLIHRTDRAGTPAGVDINTYYRGHSAPVMSLSFHNALGPHNLSDLLLSTGLDWTIRLWRVRPPGSVDVITGAQREKVRTMRPLLEIQRDEAVFDAKWSPARPGVFASVDGAGWVEVWDLNSDTETPVIRERPSGRASKAGGGLVEGGFDMDGSDFMSGMDGQGLGRSLNKCAWQGADGSKLAVGGLDGAVTVFDVGKDLCGIDGARAEEWDGVKMLVTRLEGVGL